MTTKPRLQEGKFRHIVSISMSDKDLLDFEALCEQFGDVSKSEMFRYILHTYQEFLQKIAPPIPRKEYDNENHNDEDDSV